MLVMFYYLSIFYTIAEGSKATNAGVQLLYFAPGMGAGSLLSTYIIKLTRQPKYAMMLGTTITTIALGLVALAVHTNDQNMVIGTLVMAGAGVGLSFAPAAVHARFSQPANRVAIVTAYQRFVRLFSLSFRLEHALISRSLLQFQSFGGTIGLAQAAAVLNSKVSEYLERLATSGKLSPADVATLSRSSANSLTAIDALPASLRTAVQDAFRDGVRWLFISLVPWVGITVLLTLLLSSIADSDKTLSQKGEQGVVLEEKPRDEGQRTPDESKEKPRDEGQRTPDASERA